MIHENGREENDEYPIVTCPACGTTSTDLDGFGLLFCSKCGYCAHPSATDGVCDLCSQPQGDDHGSHG